jgi:hypothetical protein
MSELPYGRISEGFQSPKTLSYFLEDKLNTKKPIAASTSDATTRQNPGERMS